MITAQNSVIWRPAARGTLVMNDDTKSKQQLIDELSRARARITELEGRDGPVEPTPTAALDAMPGWLWTARVVDVDGELQDRASVLNVGAAQRLLPLDVAPDQRWEDAFTAARDPVDDRLVTQTLATALRSGAPGYRQTRRVIDRDGVERWFNEDVSVHKVSEMEWRLYGVSVDATVQTTVERGLRDDVEQGRALAAILECAADGIVVVDEQARFTLFNAAAEGILGIGATPTSPDRWSEDYGLFESDMVTHVPPEQHPLVRALAGEYLEGERAFIRNRHRPEGVWVSSAASPIFDNAGTICGAVATFQDVTETIRAQAQLADQLRFQERQQSIARRLYELSDIETLMVEVLSEFRELLAVDGGLVCLVDEGDTHARGLLSFGLEGPPVTDLAFDLQSDGLITRVIRTGEAAWHVVDRDHAYVPGSIVRMYDLNGPSAVLPLRVGGRTIGILGLHRQEEDEERDRFTAEDINRMSPLVTDLALAIDNARLYERVREQADSLERVVSSARCLLWQGEVTRVDGRYVWDLAPVSDAAAQNVIPVDVPPGDQWHNVVGLARLPEDNALMDVRCTAAFDAGLSTYSQDYRAVDKHGQLRWLHEDVYAEPVGDGRWTVVGVTTNITERKEAEEEVRRSEEHFRRIFEDGPLGMTIVGADLEMSDVNETLCRMLGYTREEMLGLSIEAVTHPDDWATDLDQGAQVMRGEIPTYSIEKRYIKKNGDILWGRLTGAAVHDADGAPLYGVGMVEDITERKQDELLRAALYDIAEAVHTTADVQAMYRAIYASLAELVDAPRFAILLSLPDEPVDVFDVVYFVADGQEQELVRTTLPGSRSAYVARTRTPMCLSRGECDQLVDAAEIKIYEDQPSAWLGVPLLLGDELIGLAVVQHYDENAAYGGRELEIMAYIGQQIASAIVRRRAQQELTQERNLFQALMDVVPDPIYFKDIDHRFTRISKSLADIIPVDDPADAIGTTDHDTLAADVADAYRREEARIFATGQPILDLFLHQVNSDGDHAWSLVSKVPLRDAGGKVHGLVGINREVTDLMRVQEALRESETSRTQLMERMLTVQEEERARIARELHDQVGQELTSVLLGLRIVGAASSLEDAKQQVQELRDVTAATLEDVRQIAFDMRPSSLDDLGVGPALGRDLAIMGQGAGFTPALEVHNPSDLPMSTDLEVGIYRIVHTALTNVARHAHAKNVQVTIRVSEAEVSIRVQDDGTGFDSVAVMAGPVEGRFGFLSMAERAKMFGGSLSVKAEPGAGTTVLVQLPRPNETG